MTWSHYIYNNLTHIMCINKNLNQLTNIYLTLFIQRATYLLYFNQNIG